MQMYIDTYIQVHAYFEDDAHMDRRTQARE